MRAIFLSLIFALLVMVSAGVSAQLQSCGLIKLSTDRVDLEKGTSVYKTFIVSNDAGERFFIDKVNAFDSTAGIIVEAYSYDRYVAADSTGKVTVKVTALENIDVSEAKGYVELRGHFIGGFECLYEDISAEFGIKVEERGAGALVSGPAVVDCSLLEFVVPEEKVVGEGLESVNILVKNWTSERVNIRLSGRNLTLYTNLISVPAGTELQRPVYFKLKADASELAFRAESLSCEFPAKVVRLVKSGAVAADVVEMDVELVPVSDTVFNLNVKMKNTSGEGISGELNLSVPEDWSVTGLGSVSLGAGEEKTAALEVSADKPLDKKVLGELDFKFGDKEVKKMVEFSPVGFGILASAFAILAANVLAAVIVIAVIVAAFMVYRSRGLQTRGEHSAKKKKSKGKKR